MQDEWEPAIGFAQQPGNPPVNRVVAYWYGTRDDVNDYNTSVYMTYSENGAPFSNPTRIALQEPGENLPIPWPLIGQEWDYNDLGVDTGNGRFMAVWGGDGRTGATQTLRIESELLY